jgi:hypothetical protein
MEDTPIACTLSPGDLKDREKAWLKLAAFGEKSTQVAGGLAFEFKPAAGVEGSLEQLVRLEADCCPWMKFQLDRTVGKLVMTVTARGDEGQAAVRQTFAPLVARVNR